MSLRLHHWLINIVLPMTMLFFAWGCGGVATLVKSPHVSASVPKLRSTPRPTAKPTQKQTPPPSKQKVGKA